MEAPPLDYEAPEWSGCLGTTFAGYGLSVLKAGHEIECLTLPTDRPFLTLGRLPICGMLDRLLDGLLNRLPCSNHFLDVPMEHQSVSRYHAILQFRASDGQCFIYDLGSSHGTYVNRKRIPGREFVPLALADQFALGASSRLYTLTTNNLQVRDRFERQAEAKREKLLHQRQHEQRHLSAAIQQRAVNDYQRADHADINEDDAERQQRQPWQFAPVIKGFVASERAHYRKDPIRSLTDWFQERDLTMPDVEFETEGSGQHKNFIARIPLPIRPAANDQQTNEGCVFAVGQGSKRREAEISACLQACLLLDARRLFADDAQEAERVQAERKRLRDLLGDVDDAEDDSYYDRTETKSASKKGRLSWDVTSATTTVETLESLQEKRQTLQLERAALWDQMTALDETGSGAPPASDDDDDLDSFMEKIEQDLSKEQEGQWSRRLAELDRELQRVDQLIAFVRPNLLLDPPTHASGIRSAPSVVPTATKNGKPVSNAPAVHSGDSKGPTKLSVVGSVSKAAPKKASPKRSAHGTPAASETTEPPRQRSYDFVEREEDVTIWVPRSNAGINDLNAKYGY